MDVIEKEVPKIAISEIKNLVFEGGGIKGLAFVGVLQTLAEKNILKLVDNIAGASAGAITALAVSLGYSNQEIEEILKKLDFKKILEDGYGNKLLGFVSAARNYGIHPGVEFRRWISEEIIALKLGKPNATFSDLNAKVRNQREKLADAKFRDVHMIGANISTGTQEIFSYYTTPDMPLADAVRISMSIPVFFEPRTHQKDASGKFLKTPKGELQTASADIGEMYVDGGVVNNFPIELFDTDYPNPQTLGFKVDSPQEISQLRDQKKSEVTHISGFVDYGICLFNTVSSAQSKNHIRDNFRTVYVDIGNIGTTQFSLTPEEESMLINSGRKATAQHFTIQSLELLSNQNWVMKDKKRHEKLDRYKVYDRANQIFCESAKIGNLSKIQMNFTPDTKQPWWKLQEKISEYYRRLCCQPLVHHLKHAKCAPPSRDQVLILMVEPAMAEELQRWIKKQSCEDKVIKVCSNDSDLIMLSKREGTIRPKWMTINDPVGENKRKLFSLISTSNLAGVQSLLEEGVSADSFNENDKGNYLLHKAAGTQLPELINLLLDHGARIESVNYFGDTALHTAVFNRSLDMAIALLGRNANPNFINKRGETPLHLACKLGNLELIEILLNHGADIDKKDNFGDTILHKIAFQGDIKTFQFLLLNRSLSHLINRKNTVHEDTPLHIAIEKGHRDLINQLLLQGADINILNKEGKSPLSIAKEKGIEEFLQSLPFLSF